MLETQTARDGHGVDWGYPRGTSQKRGHSLSSGSGFIRSDQIDVQQFSYFLQGTVR
jgi:hypothetical protein